MKSFLRRRWFWGGLLTLLVCGWHMGWPRTAAAEGESPDVFSGLWVSASGGELRDVLRLDRLGQELAGMPFDEFFVQVRVNGDAYYQSEMVPLAVGVSPKLDPLEHMIERLRPKRVIAWFSPFRVGNANDALALEDHHVREAHPEWLSVRVDGRQVDDAGFQYLEPGLSAVQEHLAAVVQDLVKRYDLHGIYFDSVFDPGWDWGYHPDVIEQWKEEIGTYRKPSVDDPKWMAFRARMVSRSLERMSEAAREARPGIVVMAGAEAMGRAPVGGTGFTDAVVFQDHHQDWRGWLNDKLVDRLILKNFRAEVTGSESYDQWMEYALELGGREGVPLAMGLGGRLNEAVNTLAQLRRATRAGADGVVLDGYGRIVRDHGATVLFLNALERTVFAKEGLEKWAATRHERVIAARKRPIDEAAADEMVESVATAKQSQIADAEQSPLPATLAEIADEDPTLPPPPSFEEIDGVLIPVDPNQAARENGRKLLSEEDREVMESIAHLQGGTATGKPSPADPTSSASVPAGANNRLPTRRQMLLDLLKDPDFKVEPRFKLMRPDADAKEYLRRHFGNIVED